MADRNLYGNANRPRLCHLRRRPDFVGYGFNLHCDKNKVGQYIGKVDPDSPADAAGLREHDRIIEVNFVCVEDETHKEVVGRIKDGVTRNNTQHTDEVILLVVDEATDEYYFNNARPITSADPNVQRLDSEGPSRPDERGDTPPLPPPPPISDYRNNTDFTRPDVVKATKTQTPPPSSPGTDDEDGEEHYLPMTPPPSYSKQPTESGAGSTQRNLYMNTPANPPTTSNGTSRATNNSSTRQPDGIGTMNMSAAEYREQLKAKSAQKRDPRKDSQMAMKDKFDFINRM